VQPEVRRFPDGKKNGVLVIFRTNPIYHPFGLQGVFLAQQLLRLFVLTVSAQDFAGNGDMAADRNLAHQFEEYHRPICG
jgi:hypothetical protein